ncbi:unnamed protein product [Pieris macdunnoughi]|uniref:DNA repair protein XRCC4 n=1 Tax=Pieris macdunnoughi TaxID=345717 RepID=A0A821P6N7_9NEOP|nr:unnamed protein product [Pieris macdunnoughi]
MECEDTFISRFEIKGEKVYIKILWKHNEDDLFHIQVLENTSSWYGNYSLESAKHYAELVEETLEIYEKNVRQCLRNRSSDYLFDFVSSVEPSFCWKRRYEGSTAVLEHGKVNLLRDKLPEPKNRLIDFLLDKNMELTQIIKKSRETCGNLSSELEKCKKELEAFADTKISLESTLYSKFLLLLNAKKKRIQLLEDLLKENE